MGLVTGMRRISGAGPPMLRPNVPKRALKKPIFLRASQGISSAWVWSSCNPSVGSRTMSSMFTGLLQETQVKDLGTRCPLAAVP